MTKDQKLIDIYNSHFLDVYRYSMYKLGKKEEAEDVTSEVFTRLIKYERFDEIENIKAWLITVSRNLIYDKFRKKMKSVSLLQNDDDDYIEIEDESTRSFESEFVDEQLLTIVKSKLAELDSLSAEVITLKVWEDMTFKDIAGALGINENTAKQKFYRGIEKIKSDISMEVKQVEELSDRTVLSAVNKVKFEEQYQPERSFKDELFDNLFSNSIASQNSGEESKSVFIMFRKPQLLLAFYSILLFTIATVFGASKLIQNSNNNGGAYETDLDEEQELSNDSRSTIEAEECGDKTYTNDLLPEFAFNYDSCLWEIKENITTDEDNIIQTDSNIAINLISKPEEQIKISLSTLAVVGSRGSDLNCFEGEFKIINKDRSIGRVKKGSDWHIKFGIFEYSDLYYINEAQTPENSTYCINYRPNLTIANTRLSEDVFVSISFDLAITDLNLEESDKILSSIRFGQPESEFLDFTTTNFDSNFDFKYPTEAYIFESHYKEYSEDNSNYELIPSLTFILEDGNTLEFVETANPEKSIYPADATEVDNQGIIPSFYVNGEEKSFRLMVTEEKQINEESECVVSTRFETYTVNVYENIYAILRFNAYGTCDEVDKEIERLHNAESIDKLIEIIESIN